MDVVGGNWMLPKSLPTCLDVSSRKHHMMLSHIYSAKVVEDTDKPNLLFDSRPARDCLPPRQWTNTSLMSLGNYGALELSNHYRGLQTYRMSLGSQISVVFERNCLGQNSMFLNHLFLSSYRESIERVEGLTLVPATFNIINRLGMFSPYTSGELQWLLKQIVSLYGFYYLLGTR